jgi:RimJ/RimL family protein N-acetyltransferase
LDEEWPRLESARLVLDPLRPGHADELAPVLDDATLHRFIGGEPLGRDELRARYARLATGRSPDGTQRWLNWTVRRRGSGDPVGTVQATVIGIAPDAVAEIAWVIGTAYQGRGFATEAAQAMAAWLGEHHTRRLIAHIHPDHAASQAVARAVGLSPTDTVVDGEVRWCRLPEPRPPR